MGLRGAGKVRQGVNPFWQPVPSDVTDRRTDGRTGLRPGGMPHLQAALAVRDKTATYGASISRAEVNKTTYGPAVIFWFFPGHRIQYPQPRLLSGWTYIRQSYHGRLGSASPMLTAAALANGQWKNLTRSHTESTLLKKFVTVDYACETNRCSKFGGNPSVWRLWRIWQFVVGRIAVLPT